MSRLRVAHIANVALIIYKHLHNQLTAIEGAGFEVSGISSPNLDVGLIKPPGIRHISVSMTRNFTPFADLVTLWQLYRIMRREKFTIVHTHNPKPGLLGQLAAKLARVPVVINTVHGFYLHDHMHPLWRRFYILMEKVAARCSDLILSQNHEDIETAIKEGICSPQKIKYLGNGINISEFKQRQGASASSSEKRRALGLSPTGPVIGFVGRLVEEKGIIELLQAAATVVQHFPEARFLIIGPIDDEKTDAFTPASAQDYGVADYCIFPGMRQDMPELYALMDIFALPSHREGFPRSAMEAAATGVPCIVTDERGCREVVTDRRNGLLVPLKDSAALAGAIIELLGNPALAQQMGDEGRRMAEERFDEQKVFALILQEYSRLLEEKGLTPTVERPTTKVGA